MGVFRIEAKERMYLSASGQIIECILPEIRNTISRGIKVVFNSYFTSRTISGLYKYSAMP